jgi:hypothetical protein
MCKQIQKDEMFDHQSGIDPAIVSEADGSLFQGLHQALAIAEQAPKDSESLSALAALALAWRSTIDAIFEFDGFAAAPAWDIMLGLYQAHVSGISLTLADVVDLSPCAEPTTARWISALESMQLVERLKPAPGSTEPVISLANQGWLKTELALRLRL